MKIKEQNGLYQHIFNKRAKSKKAEIKRNIYKKYQKLKMKELTLEVSIKYQEEKNFLNLSREYSYNKI